MVRGSEKKWFASANLRKRVSEYFCHKLCGGGAERKG